MDATLDSQCESCATTYYERAVAGLKRASDPAPENEPVVKRSYRRFVAGDYEKLLAARRLVSGPRGDDYNEKLAEYKKIIKEIYK